MKNNKLLNFLLEFSQIALVFFGVSSALSCTATSLELSYDLMPYIVVMFIAAVLFYSLFSVLETFNHGKLYGLLGITLFYIVVNIRFFEMVKKAFIIFYNSFLKEFMKFTGSEIALIDSNNIGKEFSTKYCITLLLIFTGVYITAIVSAFFYRRRRSKVFVLLTVPFVLLPMLVGRLGYFDSVVIYLIVTVTIIGTRHMKTDTADKRMRQKLSVVLILVGIVAAASSFILVSPEKYEEKSPRLVEMKNSISALTTWSQEDIFSWIKNNFNADAIDFGKIGEKDEVVYNDNVLLKISGDVNEKHGLYLKSYVGDKYKNNKWSSLQKDENFQKDYEELSKDGITLENWHSQLRNQLGEGQKSDVEDIWKTGTLKFRNIGFGYGNYLIPMLPINDFKYEKDGHSTVDQLGTEYRQEYFVTYPYVLRRDVQIQEHGIGTDEFWSTNEAARNKLKEFAKKYYLDVPDNLKSVTEDFEVYLTEHDDMYQKIKAGAASLSDVIKLLRNYLWDNTQYSLSPGKTPSGEETVEYFLKENKKGYCVYYATAATILLRSVGIPARYVEGMHVKPDELSKALEEKREINVVDRDAHAWVEIYDDYFGFVTLEVTPGQNEDDYSNANSSEDENDQTYESNGVDSKDKEKEEKKDEEEKKDKDKKEENIDENLDGQEETQAATPTPAVTYEPEESMEFEDIEGNEELSDEEILVNNIVLGLVILLVALLVFLLIMEMQRRIRRFLFKKGFKNGTINERIILAYHNLLPAFEDMGVVYDKQTMEDYAFELVKAMNAQDDVMEKAEIFAFVEMVFHARFGPDNITGADIKLYENVYNKLRKKIYGNIKFLKKLKYMYIKGI